MSSFEIVSRPLTLPQKERAGELARPPRRRALRREEGAFLDLRLILGSLGLGALLAGGVFALGSLIPAGETRASSAAPTALAQTAHSNAQIMARLPHLRGLGRR
ncbi:MAG TPA: hypothetical protein VFB38_11295 [Chthonomonadaceae bacterium]|nr:hypothetical protein [Chthonomonadaceae bacterium]